MQKFIEDARAYLEAAESGSMSRNNSEQLAAELLDDIAVIEKLLLKNY